jgi:hypothetical protein
MITWLSDSQVNIITDCKRIISDSDDFLWLLRDYHNAIVATEAAFIAESHHPSKYGLKIFYHRALAVFAYRKQKQLSKQGLSPLVGHHGLIRVQIISTKHSWPGWGYLTEIADMDKTNFMWVKHRTFFEKLSAAHADRDTKYDNVGFDRRGRLVLCDTGTHSVHQGALC